MNPYYHLVLRQPGLPSLLSLLSLPSLLSLSILPSLPSPQSLQSLLSLQILPSPPVDHQHVFCFSGYSRLIPSTASGRFLSSFYPLVANPLFLLLMLNLARLGVSSLFLAAKFWSREEEQSQRSSSGKEVISSKSTKIWQQHKSRVTRSKESKERKSTALDEKELISS